jgi:energy-coupling factor transporter ATP-binding protein EcfA2
VSTAAPTGPLLERLAVLRRDLDALSLPVELSGSAAARAERAALIGQLDDYVLPRLGQLAAPMLVVVGGSTGAGKSTLVNTLVGAEVSRAGVLRPTTRGPVLVCAPADVEWFADDRVLPGLARTTGEATDTRSLRIVPARAIAAGLALLDAPDVDSVVAANRELATSLLAAADLWLFVTTAARYADAVPWDLLHMAAQRSTALAVVLNRVPPGAIEEIARHLAGMLAQNGLENARLLTVPETDLVAGLLPAAALSPVRQWLDGLAADADARAAVIRGTLHGTLDSLRPRVALVAAAADAQGAALARLRNEVTASYDQARDSVQESVRAGSMLRAEVLARWQEYVGTGAFIASLQSRIGAFRDRVWSALSGRRAPEGEVNAAVESSVEDLVVAAADAAAERLVRSWNGDPAGRSIVAAGERSTAGERSRASEGEVDLSRSAPALRARLGTEIRAWQAFVLSLVAQEGADKRMAARAASLGVNGVGLAVMIGVFAHTGGLTGGEVAVAGGTSVAGQRLLEAVFGDEAVRRLAGQARDQLMNRVATVLAQEEERFTGLLDAAGRPDGAPLRAAMAAVEQARHDAALG